MIEGMLFFGGLVFLVIQLIITSHGIELVLRGKADRIDALTVIPGMFLITFPYIFFVIIYQKIKNSFPHMKSFLKLWIEALKK